MGRLSVNLKHLYQCRVLWLWHIVTGGLALALVGASIARDGGAHARLGILLVALLMGLALGSCQREVVSRPFAFLLPGHGRVVPRQMLVQSALFGVLAAVCWLNVPHVSPMRRLGLVLVGGGLGAALYCAGAGLAFEVPFVSPLLGFVPLIVFGAILFSLPDHLDRAIRQFPLVTVALSAVACLWSWRLLSRRATIRRWCLSRSISFFDEFNMSKAQAYHQWRRSRRTADKPEPGSAAFIRFCLAGIRRRRPDSLVRACLANVFEWFGLMTWRSGLAGLGALVPAVLVVGYMSGGEASGVLFMMPAAMVGIALRRTYGSSFLPVGRHQRFQVAATGLLGMTALVTAGAVAAIWLTRVAAPFAPPLTLRGATLTFKPFPYHFAALPATLAPAALAARAYLRNRSAILMVVFVALFPALILTQQFCGIPTLGWILAPPVALALSLCAVHHYCMRRCIVPD